VTRRAAVIVVLALATGCGGATKATKRHSDDAIIYLKTSVSDAEVWVNDRFIARIKDLGGGLQLSPGRYRIEIRDDRYHTAYLDLRVENRERRTIPVKLAEVLP